MEKELHAKVVQALDHNVITGTATGDAIDTQGYESLMYAIQTGTITTADGTNYFEMVPQQSEDDGAGASDGVWVDVPLVDVGKGHLIESAYPRIDAAGDDDVVFRCSVNAKARHQRIRAVETGTADGAVGAVAILGHPEQVPVAEQIT